MSTVAAPRIARVLVQCWEHPGIRSGFYKSLLDADLMIAQALGKVPPPAGRPFLLIQCAITWTDGHYRDERFYIHRQFVADAVADGGVLRHGFLQMARSMASGRPYTGFDPRLVAQLQDEGRALLQRLEADPSPLAHRNVSSTAWHGLTLLPDPAAAIGRLRARFMKRRKVVSTPLDADPDAAPDGPTASYPQTNHADVRYVTNYVSIALGNDLRTLPDTAQGVIWNHWHAVTQTVETLLRVGRQTDIYVDNEGLWLRQFPALVSLLDDARDGRLRNGRLNFRPVGASSEPYPDWVRDLRGRSGVYVIRERMHDGSTPIVYVGSSSADRLYETLTRHFQTWRRRKSFWSGQYSQGHDPGLTWNRAACEVAVIVMPAQHALSNDAIKVLRAVNHNRGPLVFCTRSGGHLLHHVNDHALRVICHRAGVQPIGWHRLRHTFASHLAMRNVSLKTIQELLGHANLKMTMRYAHLMPEVRRDAVLLLDAAAPVRSTASAPPSA